MLMKMKHLKFELNPSQTLSYLSWFTLSSCLGFKE